MVRLIEAATVDRYLTTERALDAMRRLFTLEAAGVVGPAGRIDLPHDAGWVRVLPAVAGGLGVFGHKVISFNRDVGVRYVVTLFDIASGEMTAVLDGAAITGARTGATSAIAAELLAGPNTRIAAIIGTGSVARSQLAALQAVLPVEEVRVFSRRPEHRAAFIEEVESVVRVPLVDCDSVEAAVDGASLVTLATKSPDPVLFARHLVPGMHVNSVGSARPNLFEVDPAAFPEFDRVVCDSVELVFKESGDAVSAAGQGLFSPARAVDLAEVMAEEVPRRQDDVTLFKSTGSGLQDLALSVAVLEAAAADGAGTVVDEVLALKQFGVTGRT